MMPPYWPPNLIGGEGNSASINLKLHERNIKQTFESRILDWSKAANKMNCFRFIKPEGKVESMKVFRGAKSLLIR